MHVAHRTMRTAWVSVLVIASVALSACANLPPVTSKTPAPEKTIIAPGEATAPAPAPTGVSTSSPEAALKARTAAASTLGVEPDLVKIVSAEKIDWPDACLSLPDPDESCAQVITPGYRVVLSTNGQEFIYHTDESGQLVRLEPSAGETPTAQSTKEATSEAPPDGAALTLRRETDGCFDVRIDLRGVKFGACGGEMASGQFLSDTSRLEQLTEMQRIYTSFSATTPAGIVRFAGSGPVEALPVEQRMIAEWANLVAQEVKTGPGGAQYGLGWQRMGGIAGFCDDIAVDAGGHATWRSCDKEAATWRRLTSENLATLYGWLDTYSQVEAEQQDEAVADAMTVRAFLAGRSTGQGTEEDKDALLAFGSGLLQQWAESTPAQFIDTLAEVNLRRGPGEDFEVIEKIAAGQQVLVTGVNRANTWWRVVCPDDTVGDCWITTDTTLTQPVVPTSSTPEAPSIDETAILTAVIRQVYTVDSTFGAAPDFATIYLLAVNESQDAAIPYSSKARTLAPEVQEEVLAALADLSPHFEWIATAGEAPRDKNNTVEGNGAIITVGNIDPQPDGTVRVAASIYVGLLAAGGQTYVLERQDDAWIVVGTTGTSWIS